MKWIEIPYEFSTVLGTSGVRVHVSLSDYEKDMVVFKPGEEERLMKKQSEKFLKKVLTEEFKIEAIELRHLMRLYNIKQTVLARALDLTESTIFQYLKEKLPIPKDVQNKIAVYFLKNKNLET